jgi:hypothetical protein
VGGFTTRRKKKKKRKEQISQKEPHKLTNKLPNKPKAEIGTLVKIILFNQNNHH